VWDKTTTKTSALASSDRLGPLEALSLALGVHRPSPPPPPLMDLSQNLSDNFLWEWRDGKPDNDYMCCTDTPTHPPSPHQTAPQPRASPSEGRPAATSHQDRHTWPRSKFPACPPRRSAPHPQPQLGAEWACDAPTVKSRLHFCPLENHLMLVNLKVATTTTPTIRCGPSTVDRGGWPHAP
jgi:hypothetical protein